MAGATRVDYQLLIAGGGLVGALLALLSARQQPQWRVAVVEPQALGASNDKRTLALAAGSVEALQREQLWQPIAHAAQPIEHIHISDRGFAGLTLLHAEQLGVTALGQVIAAATLGDLLYQQCRQHPNIDWLSDCRVDDVQLTEAAAAVSLSDGRCLHSALVVGADGQHSQVAKALKLPMQQSDYQQVGVIANIDVDRDLQGWAYERFTETGPLALLPVGPRQASLVWSLHDDAAADMLDVSDEVFLRTCQRAFGYRAGRFVGLGPRYSFPLKLQQAPQFTAHRALLMGNAAHALHPIAGQGFNLGLRDVTSLLDCWRQQPPTDHLDSGSFAVLHDYKLRREADYGRIIGFTDTLVRSFSNRYAPLVFGRNLALLAIDHLAPARRRLATLAMGKLDN
ncbi:2-octaprenyl-6-methoxyphenyl hydroxylase [Idiomarina xiamenensis]|uniref:2-polyprenyl-6-methoxyphenol 4-hydroxylase n=1 Tax=Idiomarina xiamenensis 10-D-4 TaxID=740709 RepID=K2KM71_9GAMM|nr:2-octaprenyl-6-methoxyphenyl hydroxylase [Idiomarina xiamenensis]EKE87637.1 2-polyprenyl-6-methoxyphenol 4-hydroxylase [Idiomarina xiamenensis 10-D-4]